MFWKIVAATPDTPKVGQARLTVEIRTLREDAVPIATREVDIEAPFTNATVDAACETAARQFLKEEGVRIAATDVSVFVNQEGEVS